MGWTVSVSHVIQVLLQKANPLTDRAIGENYPSQGTNGSLGRFLAAFSMAFQVLSSTGTMGGEQKQTLEFHDCIAGFISKKPIFLQLRDRGIALPNAVELALDVEDGFPAGTDNQRCSRIRHCSIRSGRKTIIDLYNFIPGCGADNPSS